MSRVAVIRGGGIGPELGLRIRFLLVGGCGLAGVLPLLLASRDLEKAE